MKKLILLSMMFGITFTSVMSQDWHTDLDEALQLSKSEKKPIVLVFQGSDWCAPCIKLEHEIWSTDEFKTYAADHYIMLKADFPKRKQNKLSDEQQEKNNRLAERYNTFGYFPFVVVLDKNGDVLGSTGYKKVSPSEYIELLDSFKS
jgi:thioredoxin-related protein